MFSIPKTRKEALAVLRFKILGPNSPWPEKEDEQHKGEIRKAYYLCILNWHPDKWRTASQEEKKIAEENAKAINQAYAILTGKEVAEVEKEMNNKTSKECMECLFGSHLSSDGSRKKLYLFFALESGMLKQARCFLVKGKEKEQSKCIDDINIRTKPNEQNIEHKTPMHYVIQNACENPNQGWEELCQDTLLKREGTKYAVDVNISDAMGVTLIHIAAQHGRTDLMKTLIDHGADVNVLDNVQRSPLDEAMDKNYVEAVRFLLGKGASISDSMRINVDQKKYSPEMIVMLLGHPSFEIKNQTTAESSKGNETNPVSTQRETATSESMPEPTIMQDSASDKKQNNLRQVLIKHGADVNVLLDNIENILDDPNVTEILPDNTAIAFHWVAREYGISIDEKKIERVKRFSQLEPQRTFHVVVHGLRDEQVNALNESFATCSNVKVLHFKSLKLDNQYDLLTIGYTEGGQNKHMRLSQYWNNMYSKKVTKRIHLSNEIDLMKYHLAVTTDQIVGPGNPLIIFDLDTLPAEGKKIGEVKIIKGGVLLACLPKDVSTFKQPTLDLPILAVSKEGNEILKVVGNEITRSNIKNDFFKENYVANTTVSTIKCRNTLKLLEIIGINESNRNYDEVYAIIYNTKANYLFAFNRDENVIIISDKSWHYENYTTQTTTSTPIQQTQPTTIPVSTFNSNQNNGQGSSSLPENTATSQRFIIPQNSSSDNKQSNNTRSLLIDSATVAGAIIGAVALYCFAPFILGISVGIGAQLGLGIAGAAIGGGIGYLTGVAISCCSSKAHAA